MSLTDQFKKDMFLEIEGKIYTVVERQYKTQGRQGGLIILTLKDVETSQPIVKTLKAGVKLEQISPEYKEMQYLYSDDTGYFFMDSNSFETISINAHLIGDYSRFLKEGDKYVFMFYDSKAISLRRNSTVELRITNAPPAVKGNTANGASKIATTETGYKLNVPLFVEEGDIVVVNTESGEYSGRA
ncbi:elongation factor P [Candidatus Nomurabacteria bacterium]|nr:elongation factor P [Candidatus Nomurabacteria bacterium]